VAAVGQAFDRVDPPDPGTELARRGDRDLEGPQDPGGTATAVLPLRRWCDAEQRPSHQPGHARSKRLVLGDLRLDRDEVALLIHDRAEGVQQHRLADPAKPDGDHRLVAEAVLHPFELDTEGFQLRPAAGQVSRLGTGIGRVGIVFGTHRLDNLTPIYRNSIKVRKLAKRRAVDDWLGADSRPLAGDSTFLT